MDEFIDGPFKVVQRLPQFKRLGSVKRWVDQQRNNEGAVVKFLRSGIRLKVKSDDYKRLFKIISHTTEKSILEALRDGVDVSVLVNEDLPAHYYDFVISTAARLREQFNAIAGEVMELFVAKPATESRKEIAQYFTSTKYAVPLFALLDGRFEVADRLIWGIVQSTLKDGNAAYS